MEEFRIGSVEGDGPDAFGRLEGFTVDGGGRIWVPDGQARQLRVFEIFDREGRYLGPVRLPFVLRGRPAPIVRDGVLYGVTRNELDVQYVVRARVVRPEVPPSAD